ncbi:MAG: acetylxylan esterase [Bacteroides sp.]|nr:acetylxylan esterase [Bacteroides sp.]
MPRAWFVLDGNSGIFVSGAPHVLKVELRSSSVKTVHLVLELSDDFGRHAGTFDEYVKIAPGGAEAEFDLSLEPGFYKAVLFLEGNDGTRTELARTNLGCCPEQISSPQDKQPDFDEFWTSTLDQLAATDARPELSLIEEYSNDVRRTWRVDMTSFGGERISGLLVEPVAPGKYPAMISYMGYGSNVWYSDPSSNPEMIEFMLCIRNQALNRKPGEPDDWCTRGLESKETYYYRGAFADAVRAVDFVCSREKTDLSRVFANGESQGGALTLVAASLDGRIRAIAPSAPFLNDFRDYFSLVHWPADPILAAAEQKGITEDELYRTLSYFDVKNFTDRIKCPVLMAIGLQDPVCPPHTNFAGYNMVKSEKNWICYPLSGHNVWEQPGWPEAKNEFFRKFM